MKKIVMTALLSAFSLTAFAQTNSDIDLKVKLNYLHNKILRTVNADTKIPQDQNKWVMVQNNSEQNIMILSKLDRVDSKSVMVEFLVVDMGKNPGVISKPKMIVAFGQQGKMIIHDKSGKMELSVLADV